MCRIPVGKKGSLNDCVARWLINKNKVNCRGTESEHDFLDREINKKPVREVRRMRSNMQSLLAFFSRTNYAKTGAVKIH